tara:strand:- start:552 stop:1064 length:513 start_codon:yes stop_codon:yes gene_type:complete
MPFTKLLPTSIDLAQNFTFTGTVLGAGNSTPNFSVYADDTSISDATHTTIVFPNEDYDSDNAFASNTFTVPSGKQGKYFLHARIRCMGGNTTGVRDAVLRIRNGSTTISTSTAGLQANRQEVVQLTCSGIFDLSASDAITCDVLIDNVGGTSNYGGGNDRDTAFTGFKLL